MLAGSTRFDFSRSPPGSACPRGTCRTSAWRWCGTRRGGTTRCGWLRRSHRALVRGRAEKAAAKVDDGRLDVAFGQSSPTLEQDTALQRRSGAQKRLYAHVGDSVRYINLNLAVPPFDDVHVRKAVNLAIDKQALRHAARGGLGGQVAGHIAPDALSTTCCSTTTRTRRPANAATSRPRRQRWRSLATTATVTASATRPPAEGCSRPCGTTSLPSCGSGRVVRDNLRPIGIELDVKAFDPDTYFGKTILPQSRVPVIPALGVSPDYPQCRRRLPAPLPRPARRQSGRVGSLAGRCHDRSCSSGGSTR